MSYHTSCTVVQRTENLLYDIHHYVFFQRIDE